MTRRQALAERARQVEHEFPGWHIWISSLDRWWAVRQGPDAHHGRDDRRPMTLDADDAAGLRALLAHQSAPEQPWSLPDAPGSR